MTQAPFITAIRVPAQSQFAATAARDYYKLHKLVYTAFPTKEAATAARVLFRFDVEGDDAWLYVQSIGEPDWSRLPDKLRLEIHGPVPLAIPKESRLRFRLLAKPSYRIGRKDSPYKGVRTTIDRPDGQLEWLRRKGQAGGFAVEECRLLERVWHDSKKPEFLRNGDSKPIYCVQFDGVLNVTDWEGLEYAVANGIGTQKAFGFGLLSLARV